MKHSPIRLLDVFLDGSTRRKVGRLAFERRRILFEYDPALLTSGLNISPFKLPAKPGTFAGDGQVFDGLFGVFNDSLPDGWGRLLLNRAVEKLGIARAELTPLDRLAHVGCHGMGALSYEPRAEHVMDSARLLDRRWQPTFGAPSCARDIVRHRRIQCCAIDASLASRNYDERRCYCQDI